MIQFSRHFARRISWRHIKTFVPGKAHTACLSFIVKLKKKIDPLNQKDGQQRKIILFAKIWRFL